MVDSPVFRSVAWILFMQAGGTIEMGRRTSERPGFPPRPANRLDWRSTASSPRGGTRMVRQAKICHRDQPTPEHHRLLSGYLLRAEELRKNGMPAAAQEVAMHLLEFGVTDSSRPRQWPHPDGRGPGGSRLRNAG